MTRILLLSLCALLSTACAHKTISAKADKHYELSGRVTALDAKNHVATVDGAAIPNFMEAMTMEYPVKSEPEFDKLKVGEKIKAALTVHEDNSYDLSDIRAQDPAR